MSLIEKLTDEQHKLIPIIRDEWIDFCLGGNTEINRDMASKGLRWIYGLANLDSPRIIFVNGPFACQIAVWLIEELSKQKIIKGPSVRASKKRFEEYGWCDLGGSAGWTAWIDYFDRIGIKINENFVPWRDLMKSGIFMSLYLRGFAVVCPRPAAVHKDDRGRLHNANGPAVEWEGEKYWFWHGTRVNEKIILRPNELTAEEISNEKNSEISRAIAEKLGWDRYMEVLGTTLVDKWFDPSKKLHYELYDFKNRKFSLMPRLLKMESPEILDGSRPYYIEPVDPGLNSCKSARRWQFTKENNGEWPTVDECNKNPELSFEIEA